jgi:glycosyltransferase involved in cell wall biosynthesis
MKIGALVHMYPPMHNAGAEHMLHAMLREMVNRGHEAVVVVDDECGTTYAPYIHDSVRVSSDKRSLKGIDVLITHLDRTPTAEKMAETRGIPLVQLFHNHERPTTVKKCDLAVYNSEHLLKHAPMSFDTPTVVVRPPVWPEHYRIEEKDHTRKYITLINLQKAKGVEMFYTLAQMFPDLPFLGVKGSYGLQVPPPAHLKNVTIIDNQPDIRKVYAQTAILLMPSSYESYGRCAVEASCSGIPVIAHPTAGLREALQALDSNGLFPLPDSKSWAAAIEYVRETYPARVRDAFWVAKNLDPDGDMDRFEEALLSVASGVHSVV